MAVTLTPTHRNARAAVVLSAVDAGTGPGTVQLRTGTRPADPTVTATGTLVVTFTLADPAFPTPTAKDTVAAAVAQVQAATDGTPTWARVLDSDGTAVFDLSAGGTGSGADVIISPAALTEGQDVDLVSMTWTEPDGVA
jgi:hypothetical protein